MLILRFRRVAAGVHSLGQVGSLKTKYGGNDGRKGQSNIDSFDRRRGAIRGRDKKFPGVMGFLALFTVAVAELTKASRIDAIVF